MITSSSISGPFFPRPEAGTWSDEEDLALAERLSTAIWPLPAGWCTEHEATDSSKRIFRTAEGILITQPMALLTALLALGYTRVQLQHLTVGVTLPPLPSCAIAANLTPNETPVRPAMEVVLNVPAAAAAVPAPVGAPAEIPTLLSGREGTEARAESPPPAASSPRGRGTSNGGSTRRSRATAAVTEADDPGFCAVSARTGIRPLFERKTSPLATLEDYRPLISAHAFHRVLNIDERNTLLALLPQVDRSGPELEALLAGRNSIFNGWTRDYAGLLRAGCFEPAALARIAKKERKHWAVKMMNSLWRTPDQDASDSDSDSDSLSSSASEAKPPPRDYKEIVLQAMARKRERAAASASKKPKKMKATAGPIVPAPEASSAPKQPKKRGRKKKIPDPNAVPPKPRCLPCQEKHMKCSRDLPCKACVGLNAALCVYPGQASPAPHTASPTKSASPVPVILSAAATSKLLSDDSDSSSGVVAVSSEPAKDAALAPCTQCRKLKRACSKTQPCSRCTKRGVTCTYADREPARQEPDPIPRRELLRPRRPPSAFVPAPSPSRKRRAPSSTQESDSDDALSETRAAISSTTSPAAPVLLSAMPPPEQRIFPPMSSAPPARQAAVVHPFRCLSCKGSHMTCDGVSPTCSRCVALGLDCQYPAAPLSAKKKPLKADATLPRVSLSSRRRRRRAPAALPGPDALLPVLVAASASALPQPQILPQSQPSAEGQEAPAPVITAAAPLTLSEQTALQLLDGYTSS